MAERLDQVLIHIKKLLTENSIPQLEGDLANISGLREIHDEIETIRDVLSVFSSNQNENIHDLIENIRKGVDTQNSAMVKLKKSESKYKYLASHDQLTGALNRQSFIERTIVELENSFRMKNSCGIIMIDIDHFKKFNDTYGHLAGDKALRHTVHVISSFTRKHDFLGRYGGEEFVLFFGNADSKTAFAMTERIREAVQNNPVVLDFGPVPITASFGLAMFGAFEYKRQCEIKSYIETIINNADDAMYRAKKAGRNRAVLYDPNEHTALLSGNHES